MDQHRTSRSPHRLCLGLPPPPGQPGPRRGRQNGPRLVDQPREPVSPQVGTARPRAKPTSRRTNPRRKSMNIGLDIGYGATKTISGNWRSTFPSVVGTPDKARSSLNENESIILLSPDHVQVGEGAVRQSRFIAPREDRAWITSEHDALPQIRSSPAFLPPAHRPAGHGRCSVQTSDALCCQSPPWPCEPLVRETG